MALSTIYMDLLREGASFSDGNGVAIAGLDRGQTETLLAAAEMLGLLGHSPRNFEIVVRNAGGTVAHLRLSSEPRG
jgi:hypothetical protein